MDSQGKYQTLTSFHDHMAIGGDGSEKVQTSCWDWHRSLQTVKPTYESSLFSLSNHFGWQKNIGFRMNLHKQ